MKFKLEYLAYATIPFSYMMIMSVLEDSASNLLTLGIFIPILFFALLLWDVISESREVLKNEKENN